MPVDGQSLFDQVSASCGDIAIHVLMDLSATKTEFALFELLHIKFCSLQAAHVALQDCYLVLVAVESCLNVNELVLIFYHRVLRFFRLLLKLGDIFAHI